MIWIVPFLSQTSLEPHILILYDFQSSLAGDIHCEAHFGCCNNGHSANFRLRQFSCLDYANMCAFVCATPRTVICQGWMRHCPCVWVPSTDMQDLPFQLYIYHDRLPETWNRLLPETQRSCRRSPCYRVPVCSSLYALSLLPWPSQITAVKSISPQRQSQLEMYICQSHLQLINLRWPLSLPPIPAKRRDISGHPIQTAAHNR